MDRELKTGATWAAIGRTDQRADDADLAENHTSRADEPVQGEF